MYCSTFRCRRPIASLFLTLFPTLLVLGAVGLGCSSGPGTPSVDSLRDSFSRQISTIEFVEDFTAQGDEITFKRPDGSGELIEWRVVIKSLSVEPQDDDASPYRGNVSSSWFLNGEEIKATATASYLPMWILESGISQECWALWDPETTTWGWT